MSTSGKMNGQMCMYLLIFSSFTFVCICGKHPGLSPSCEDRVSVRSKQIIKTAPRKSLTIECPAQHCGDPVNITWCKLSQKTDDWEQLNNTKNVEIRQEDNQGHKLTSYLTFKNISFHDAGYYRCSFPGQISQKIRISVSDSHKDFSSDQNDAVAESLVADDDNAHNQSESWLPYFLIVFGVALVVAVLTVITLGGIPCRKRVLTVTHTDTQEMPSHVIPNLPKASAPPIAVLQANFFPQDGNSPNAVRPTLRPPQRIRMNQHRAANPADPNQRSQFGQYAAINRQSVVQSGEQHVQVTARRDPQYAAINRQSVVQSGEQHVQATARRDPQYTAIKFI